MFVILFFLISITSTTQALKLPEQYDYNQCELIAKDYQDMFFGDIVYIQPLKENGAFDFGAYKGHWINKAWNKERGIYYIDYKSQSYFNSTDEIKQWYEWVTGKQSMIYNVNQGGGVPFGIKYYY